MSKAGDWVKTVKARPAPFRCKLDGKVCELARVTDKGELEITQTAIYRPREALALARWIGQTFGGR